MDAESRDLEFAAVSETAFRENVVQIRQSKQISQSELARLVGALGVKGFHQQTVQRIESGQRPVRLVEALAIASALGTDLPGLLQPYGRDALKSWVAAMATTSLQELGRLEAMLERHGQSLGHAAEQLDDGVTELEDTWDYEDEPEDEFLRAMRGIVNALEEVTAAIGDVAKTSSRLRHPSRESSKFIKGLADGLDPEAP